MIITFETIETERLLIRKLDSETMNRIFDNYSEDEVRKILGIASESEFERQKRMNLEGY